MEPVDQAHLINLVSQFLAWAVRNGNDDLRLVMEYAGQQLVKEVMQPEHQTEQIEDQPREEVMPTQRLAQACTASGWHLGMGPIRQALGF